MNAEWYNKLARLCEEDKRLGTIEYRQIEIIAEFIAKEDAALRARVEALEAIVKDFEHIEDDEARWYCPDCHFTQPKHAPHCRIAAALKA